MNFENNRNYYFKRENCRAKKLPRSSRKMLREMYWKKSRKLYTVQGSVNQKLRSFNVAQKLHEKLEFYSVELKARSQV